MNRPPRAIPYLIGFITLVVFGSLCFHEFTFWDDNYNIWQNPRFNPPTVWSVAWYWHNIAHGLYIPLTYSVWGVLAKLAYLQQAGEFGARLNPYVFHAANVILHVISALLAWGIVRRVVRNDWAACIGALVFALHSVQVEAVGWVAGLKDVMCGMLSFLAIWLYLRAVDESDPLFGADVTSMRKPLRRQAHGRDAHATESPQAFSAPTRTVALYIGATVALILAMLSKPTAMVVPAIAFVLHVWGLGRPARVAVAPLTPWFVLSIICAVVAKLAQPAHGVPAAPLWARPLIAGDSLAFYLYKLVFPARLGIDYGWRPTLIMHEWWFYVLWIVPVIVFGWLLVNHKRKPVLFAAGALFVIAVSPVLGLTTFLFQYFSTVADHYLYISMLGPAIAVGWLVAQRMNRGVVLASCIVLAALGARSIVQTQVWQDDFTLFTNAIRVNPDSFFARHNLGLVYKLSGHLDTAEQLIREAIRIKPDYWEARQQLADILFMIGRADEGVEQVKTSIQIKKQLPAELGIDYVEDHIRLGDTLMSIARHDEAAEQYRMALALRSDHPTARQKLAEALEKSGAAAPSAPARSTAPSTAP